MFYHPLSIVASIGNNTSTNELQGSDSSDKKDKKDAAPESSKSSRPILLDAEVEKPGLKRRASILDTVNADLIHFTGGKHG